MKAQLDLHDDARRFRPPLTEAGLVPEGGFAARGARGAAP